MHKDETELAVAGIMATENTSSIETEMGWKIFPKKR